MPQPKKRESKAEEKRSTASLGPKSAPPPAAPILPKKALTAYQLFTKDMMKILKPQLKQIANPQQKCQELLKLTSQKWQDLDALEKEKYECLSQKDLQRHRNQLNQYKVLGYFLLENGKKSTEIAPSDK